MLGDPLQSQYRSRISLGRTNMKLLLIFTAILALSLAEEKKEELEDSEAEASVNVELLKQGSDLKRAASTYVPSQRSWNSNNYVQQPAKPTNTWTQPAQNNYYKPENNYPQNNYPQNNYPQQNYPQQNYPQNNYPQNNSPNIPVNVQPPNNNLQGHYPQSPQNDYYQGNNWNTPATTTTTESSVIKNEQYQGPNGEYKYEYQMSDGTSVGEQGWYVTNDQKEEDLVKKGWYSYIDATGKNYTVTYWADKTGYHAFGEHLPTPHPIPPAIQASLDQQQQSEDNKPLNDYYAPTSAPTYYPTPAPTYRPTSAPAYYPTQAPTYRPTQAPVYQTTPAPAYYPTHAPTYYPTPVNDYYQQPSNYPNQQPAYYPNQQQNYPGYGK